MDLGIYLSTKKKLVVWIIGPVLFLSVLFLPVFIYFKSINNNLSEKKFMLESMPTIIEKITMAQSTVKSYQSNASKAELIEWVNSQLNYIANDSGFVIDSLIVKKDNSKNAEEAITVYEISIKGKGELDKIVSFFNKSQSMMPLLTLDSMQLRTVGQASERIYDTQLSFAYNNLS